jgi:ABC-type multidrug transport system fused ATPase/permease subunit
MGTHEELLEREGLYKRLVNMQSSLARIVAVAG